MKSKTIGYTHLFDYFMLCFSGVVFLAMLSIAAGERFLQLIIVTTYVSIYVLWGMYHHIKHDDLHLKTVLEYVLIGFTILFLLKLIIFP